MLIDYTFSDYVKVMVKRRGRFAIIVGTSVLIASLLSFSFPKIYQTELIMYVPTTMDLISFIGRGGTPISRPLLPNLSQLWSGAVLGVVKSDRLGELLKQKLGEEKPRPTKYIIDYSPDYGFYEVQVNDRDRERAARIANLIPDVANELIVEISEGSLKKNIEYIEEELEKARKELAESRSAKARYQEKYIHIVLGAQSSMIISKNVEYQVQYQTLGVELASTRATIDALKEQMANEAQFFIEEESVTQDPIIQKLRDSLTEKEMKMAGLRTQYTELHPVMIALQKEIEDTKELIRREVERLYTSETKPSNSFYESLRQNSIQNLVNLTTTEAQRDALTKLIEESNKILLSLPTIENEYAEIVFNEQVGEKIVDGLVSKLSELQLQVGRQFQTFVVMQSAKTPTSPSFPILWLNVLIALVFGIVGGMFYCTLLEYFERAKVARYADSETDSSQPTSK